MPSIKFGIIPDTQGTPAGRDLVGMVRRSIEEVQVAEKAGFDGAFLTEHHQEPTGFIPSPLTLMAAMAARTEEIKLGTAVLLLPLYHPVQIAEETAVLDLISNGRIILGVGMGYQEQDFRAFGVDRKQRVSRFEEGIQIVRGALMEDRFSFSGKRFQVENLALSPKPVQHPLPIWIGARASTPAAIERAGRLGDGWISNPLPGLEMTAEGARRYRQAAAEHGRPGPVVLLREAWVGESEAAAREQYGPAVLAKHRKYYQRGAYEAFAGELHSEEDITIDWLAGERILMGSPEDCIRQIERWHEATGAEWFLLRFSLPGGPSHGEILQAMRLFGRRVIPHFH
ncbi:MAG TPA: LLM class flavin-dependent oxidoreductase [Dehalococcoidia bacterium]|nr:LLM class flavin-dependent oxidoreductase [Dehalococcoidia bacterium]